MQIAILFNKPTLPPGHPDYKQESGVLESVTAIKAALIKRGHVVSAIGLGESIKPLLSEITTQRPDVVVNLCESFAGRSDGEAHVTAVLELLSVPYTGSPPECLALVRDKARTKWLLQGAGLPTAPFVRLQPGEPPPAEPLTNWLNQGPLFVKPAAEDASLGIGPDSVVVDWQSLERQVARIAANYGSVLVERFIDGREFNVGVITISHEGAPVQDSISASRRDAATCLPLAEIEFRTGDELRWPIVTYDGKWSLESRDCIDTPVRCPAVVEPGLAESIRATAVAAFQVTGCRDYARVDLRVDRSGNIFILEVNANPDVGPTAGFSRALAAAGIPYAEFVERLVATAAERGADIPVCQRCD